IFRRNVAHISDWLSSGFRYWVAFELEVAADLGAAERHGRDERSTLDTGQGFESLDRLADVTTACVRVVISRSAKGNSTGQNVVSTKPRSHVAKRDKAPHHKAHTDEEHDSQRNLRHYQRITPQL